jgi:hypothetical protein
VTAANDKGVYPWTRDVSLQLSTRLGELEQDSDMVAAAVGPWRTRHGTVESTVRNWGKRFRRRWGLKYGRGIIMTPMGQTEMERKVFLNNAKKKQNNYLFWGPFFDPKNWTT